jgi:hypothetical protein
MTKTQVTAYDEAAETLGKRQSRKVGNNTYLRRRDEHTIAVKLHATDVVVFNSDGTVTLHDGGYLTPTTKDRINTYLPRPYRVYSDRGQWYLYEYSTEHGTQKVFPYFDGIRLAFNPLRAVNASDGPDIAKREKENAKLKREINAYVALYTNERVKELLESETTAGDCLFCQFTTEGDSVGDVVGDVSHLRYHLAESYTMISTLYNAVKAKGYANPAVILRYSPDLARRALATYLRNHLLSGVQTR